MSLASRPISTICKGCQAIRLRAFSWLQQIYKGAGVVRKRLFISSLLFPPEPTELVHLSTISTRNPSRALIQYKASTMQIKSLLLAPLVATGLVTANPSPSKPYRFEALAFRSAIGIHFAVVQAAHSSIFLKLPKQKATYDKKTDNSATFSTVNSELFLYGKIRQQIYVDRSGMGMSFPNICTELGH